MGETGLGGLVVIINENIPIQGVTVSIPGLGLQTTTNSIGNYNFGIINWVDPNITINFTHPNFHPVSRSVVLQDGVNQAEDVGMLPINEDPPPPGDECVAGDFFCDGTLLHVCIGGEFVETQEFCSLQSPSNLIPIVLGAALVGTVAAFVFLKKK